MHIVEKQRVIYFDVDSTIVMWEPELYEHTEEELITIEDEHGQWKLLPNKANIEFMVRFKQQGCAIVLWSAAGGEWALKIAKLLKIEHLIDVVLSKPDICVDDLKDANLFITKILWKGPELAKVEDQPSFKEDK